MSLSFCLIDASILHSSHPQKGFPLWPCQYLTHCLLENNITHRLAPFCLMHSSSALKSSFPYICHESDALPVSNKYKHPHLPPLISDTQWRSGYSAEPIRLILPTMSGFLSSDAEAALRADDEAYLFYPNRHHHTQSAGSAGSPYYPSQQWTPVGYTNMSFPPDQVPADSFPGPSQYVSWPSTSLPPLTPVDYPRVSYPPSSTPVVPSTPYPAEAWPNAPWPTLHPDDAEASSSNSRSVSPNPNDLHHFGILLPDGKSWRCAYKGCTSQARFTRGCDLRKHFRRHTKSLFCRHEDCPQSKDGGFSSRKDRDRHESRHKPGVVCSHDGCGRVFSRVDNMKDHVRRIHDKKA